MKSPHQHWVCWVSFSERYNRKCGVVETKITTHLAAHPDAVHRLSGEHGRRVLMEVAERWNHSGYRTSSTITKCRADYLTEKSQKNFTLKDTK